MVYTRRRDPEPRIRFYTGREWPLQHRILLLLPSPDTKGNRLTLKIKRTTTASQSTLGAKIGSTWATRAGLAVAPGFRTNRPHQFGTVLIDNIFVPECSYFWFAFLQFVLSSWLYKSLQRVPNNIPGKVVDRQKPATPPVSPTSPLQTRQICFRVSLEWTKAWKATASVTQTWFLNAKTQMPKRVWMS